MKKKTYLLTSLLLIATLVLSGFTTQVAHAEDLPEEDELEFEGIVEEIFDDGSFSFRTEEDILILVGAIEDGSFQLTVGDEDPLTILVEEGFEFGEIFEGDEFEIEAKLNEDEEWELYKFKIQEQEQEREREEEGYFCTNLDEKHPVAAAIAETYEVDYEVVIGMFCAGEGEEGSARTGFGQIMLAFHTAEVTGGDPGEILGMKKEGTGWGQIWQEMGLIGKDREKPDKPGKPEDVGPPEGKGKPEDVGKPENPGKPDHAGPKH